MDQPADYIESFIVRWQGADGRERANYQLFLTELAALLDLPSPEPASADDRDNAYVFERRVDFHHGDGSESRGYIDLYRRGCFVLEAKDARESSDRRYDDTMLRARSQAENYARALPAVEGRPPFVVVVDVGRMIELYSEFSRSGAAWTPFPDPRNHRARSPTCAGTTRANACANSGWRRSRSIPRANPRASPARSRRGLPNLPEAWSARTRRDPSRNS